MADETTEVEGQQPTAPSTENQTTGENAGEGELTTPEEGQVPFHEHPRFKQLVEEKNQLKEDLETLKESQPTTEEEPPSDWKEVKDKAVAEATAKIEETLQKRTEAQEVEDREMEVQFNSLRGLGHEISQDDEKAILKRMIEKDENVLSAFQGYSQGKSQQQQTQQQKTEGVVPPSKGAETSSGEFSYSEIRTKSLDDLIEEASE